MRMTGRAVRPPTSSDLDRATRVVRAQLAPTPVLPSDLLPDALLKLETAQPTGSFKVRGALAALSALPEGVRAVAPSAGNHGLGVAFAAARLDRPATVVVATTAAPAKVAALARWPVELVRHGNSYDDAEAHALELAETGGALVSGYNDPQVIAGGATIGAELDEQVEGPLTVVAPLGGGGLCSGLALWAAGRPGVRLVGVETARSRAVSTALAAGRVVPIEVGPTAADGLAGNLEAGSVTLAVLRVHRPPIVAVSEAEIAGAVRWLFDRHGLVVEGSGAVGVAAILAGRVPAGRAAAGGVPADGMPAGGAPSGGRVVVVLTGRNIDPVRYTRMLSDE